MDLQTDAPVSDVDLMQSFIDLHKDTPRAEEKPPVDRTQQTAEASPEDEDDGLDFETLEKLGLASEDQPDSGSEREDDAQAQDLDLEPFAKALGVDAQELSVKDGEVMVRTKVDGEVATVPLSKLREGYQLKSHFTRQQEQFLEERRQWEASKAQAEATLYQQAQLADALLNQEEQQLNREYTRDWTRLRQEDPAEYAAQIAEYNQKLQQLRGRRAQIASDVQARVQETNAQLHTQRQEAMRRESQQLIEKLSWDTPEKAQEGVSRMREYLSKRYGLTQKDLDPIIDHRAFLVIDKARKYDELMEKVETAKKRVPTAPHAMPSGSPAKQPKGRRSKIDQAKRAHAQSHSIESAASVFEQMGIA